MRSSFAGGAPAQEQPVRSTKQLERRDSMSRDFCWIEAIQEDEADRDLADLYAYTRADGQPVGNLYKAFGLRPHFLKPAHDLYLAGLHEKANVLPAWVLELVSSYVAILTRCEYAAAHHGENFLQLHPNRTVAKSILESLKAGRGQPDLLDKRESAILNYTRRLTEAPERMVEDDVEGLRSAGLHDGEILEVNQTCAMFNYWSRVINGLGIRLGDEKIGRFGNEGNGTIN